LKKVLNEKKEENIMMREKEILFWILKRQPKENKRRKNKSLHR